MSLEKWTDLIGEDELRAYEKAGLGKRMGFGKRPALLNVDMTYMFLDPAYAATSGDMSSVLKAVAHLTSLARQARIPLFYSRRDDRDQALRRGIWNLKLGSSGEREYTTDKRADEWPPEIAPRAENVVISKNKPSPFFGTALASMLTYGGIDTLIVVGLTTSGCVRAAVVDAFSYNYRAIIPEECVGDRCRSVHRANLFDMDMKYGDVVPLEEVVAYLRSFR